MREKQNKLGAAEQTLAAIRQRRAPQGWRACAAVGLAAGALLNPHVALLSIVAAVIIALLLKMAKVWQKLATA